MSNGHAPAFVAESQIPPSPPPSSATGMVGWLRENLFSSPLNIILSIGSIALVLWVVPGILQWAFVDSVWFATSVDECRAINPDGACWAVIVQRFDQFIYGFYPAPLRWRPNLAFVLLVISVAYVLFDWMPLRRAGLLLAALFPVIAWYLIWGGPIWLPVLIVLTVPITYVFYKVTARFADKIFAVAVGAAAAAIWVLLFVGPIDTTITRAIGNMNYTNRVAELQALQADPDEIRTQVANFHSAELADIGDEAARADKLDSLVDDRVGKIEAALSDLNRLKDDATEIASLRAEAQKMRTTIPSDYNGITSLSALEHYDVPPDVAAQLRDAIALEDRANTLNLRVTRVYKDLGQIGLMPVSSRSLGGFLLSTIIGVAGIVLSLPFGILLALGRRSGMVFIKTLCVVFIEFIRGVPLITLLFVANSVLAYFFPPGSSIDLIVRVVIMVTMFSAAYMAEVIRGGLAALPTGQYEASDSLGLDYWKSMRLIILPQALKVSIPNIVSTFIGLFKDTTLVVVIGLLDPIGLISAIRADAAWNGLVWEFYVFVAAFFWIICFGMSRYSQRLERKLATDRR